MRTLLAATLALALCLPPLSPAVYGQGEDPVVVAQAFNAAWNAHDLAAVLAFFAPAAAAS